jgi:hypothetical protein
MLQASILNVSSIFQMYVARCCVCFCNGFKYFLGVFASVLDVCFKYFICFQTYVASVAFECFKSRLGVASPSSPSAASSQCLLLPTPARHLPPPPSLLDVGDVRGPMSRVDAQNDAGKGLQVRRLDAPSVQALASPIF